MPVTELTLHEVRMLAFDVQERRGWDFSPVRIDCDAAAWDYGEVAERFMDPHSRVLDVGTGGGEIFVELAPGFGEGLGIDSSDEMIRVATENLPSELAGKVAFKHARAEALDVPDRSFDVVLNRHCSVDADEVVRVLKAGGYFVTQQIGDANDGHIFDAFDWGSNGQFWMNRYRTDGGVPPTDLGGLSTEFEQLGCRVVAKCEYNIRCWFKDVRSLIFQLKAAPYPEVFEPERHWRKLNRLLRDRASSRGIENTQHRWLLVVGKP